MAKNQTNLKEAVVLVPLTYNNGSRIPDEIQNQIDREIFETFHGWTKEGIVQGAYRMIDGEQRTEELQRVSVILQAADVPKLETMVARWCGLLEQEVMLLKISDSTVKFIPPKPGDS
jgi:hypothetical protein